MAFGYYMNMEKLSLNIAGEHIVNMTNDNMEDDVFLSEDKLINNLKNGSVVVKELTCFFESYLNTILNACIEYSGEDLLKCSESEKLDIIFMHYKKDFTKIKRKDCWGVHKKCVKVRNYMTHFKKNYIGMGTGIPKFELAKQDVEMFFTKDNMEKMYAKHIELTRAIAEELNLNLFEDISVFECEGRDGLVNYVYDGSITDIDESRF